MRYVLGLQTWNLLPRSVFGFNLDWTRPAGRMIWTTLLFVVLLAPLMAKLKQPKSKLKATWAQAMAGSVYVWILMILAYGNIPHEWLTFANGYLKWDESHFILSSGQKIVGPVRWLNFDVDKRAITDVIVSGMYIVFLSFNVALFAKWQKRPAAPADDAPAASEDKVVGTSAFGRPVTAKA